MLLATASSRALRLLHPRLALAQSVDWARVEGMSADARLEWLADALGMPSAELVALRPMSFASVNDEVFDLADADRIRFVADIVASQRRTVGVDPMVVCSAMGSSTNQLLAAGDFALDGKLYTDAIRKLHIATCDDLGVDDNTRADVEVGEKETGPCIDGWIDWLSSSLTSESDFD